MGFFAAVRDAGLGFRVYGVNSPEALAEAARLGAAAFTCRQPVDNINSAS